MPLTDDTPYAVVYNPPGRPFQPGQTPVARWASGQAALDHALSLMSSDAPQAIATVYDEVRRVKLGHTVFRPNSAKTQGRWVPA